MSPNLVDGIKYSELLMGEKYRVIIKLFKRERIF